RDALSGDHRRRRLPRRRPRLRGSSRDPGRDTADRLPDRHHPPDRPFPAGRCRVVLGPGPGGVRRHDHLRRELSRTNPDHAPGRVRRPGVKPRRGRGPVPGAAAGVHRRPGGPARPVAQHWNRSMKPRPAHTLTGDHHGDGVAVDPRGDELVMSGTVQRGTFILEADLVAAPGQVLAVLGPNGAGKTTLLRALSGLDALTTGSIHLGGLTFDDAATDTFMPTERRPVGLVFQDYRLFPHLDVRDNVAY